MIIGPTKEPASFPNSCIVSPRRQARREKMDTDPKTEKPTDCDLEIAVFGAP